ncbi:hypothetical protein EV126DRAFT_409201 [Verticillium dahliae]|nr:hypothetical protein EV126DRAFT_409201 [Verticillium dahliae]
MSFLAIVKMAWVTFGSPWVITLVVPPRCALGPSFTFRSASVRSLRLLTPFLSLLPVRLPFHFAPLIHVTPFLSSLRSAMASISTGLFH